MFIGGYVKLHRSILASDIWKSESNVLKTVVITCLLRAEYQDIHYHGIFIPRGSFLIKQGQFAKELKTSRRNLRDILLKLVNARFIAKQHATFGTIITVCHYDIYQSSEEASTPSITPSTTPAGYNAQHTQRGIKPPPLYTKNTRTQLKDSENSSNEEPEKLCFYENEIPSLRSLYSFNERDKLKTHLMNRGFNEHEAANILEKVYSLEYTGKVG